MKIINKTILLMAILSGLVNAYADEKNIKDPLWSIVISSVNESNEVQFSTCTTNSMQNKGKEKCVPFLDNNLKRMTPINLDKLNIHLEDFSNKSYGNFKKGAKACLALFFAGMVYWPLEGAIGYTCFFAPIIGSAADIRNNHFSKKSKITGKVLKSILDELIDSEQHEMRVYIKDAAHLMIIKASFKKAIQEVLNQD